MTISLIVIKFLRGNHILYLNHMIQKTKENNYMPEKFSIQAKKINIQELNIQIQNFEKYNNFKPYIFANHETIKELDSIVGSGSELYVFKESDCFVGEFTRHRVYQDSTLRFGEVELR
mgnify:CR=1 FL=1